MKKTIVVLIAVMTITAMTVGLSACRLNIGLGDKTEEKTEQKQEEQKETKDPVQDVLKAVVPPEDFELAGEYQDETSQRASMTITPEGEDHSQVEISWGDSASETTVWTFEGDFDYAGGMLSYKKGRKVIDSFSESEGEKEKVLYKDGTGALLYYEEGLHWQDDKEDAGKDCHFVKTGDLDNVVIEDEQ